MRSVQEILDRYRGTNLNDETKSRIINDVARFYHTSPDNIEVVTDGFNGLSVNVTQTRRAEPVYTMGRQMPVDLTPRYPTEYLGEWVEGNSRIGPGSFQDITADQISVDTVINNTGSRGIIWNNEEDGTMRPYNPYTAERLEACLDTSLGDSRYEELKNEIQSLKDDIEQLKMLLLEN